MSEEVQFNRGPAQRPAPLVTDPLIQWATGLQTKERTIYSGWLIETNKHDELDEAMGAAGVQPIVIKHGTGSMVKHWSMPTASMFVIADGVQSISEMKHTPDRLGIAFGWRQVEGGRRQSVLRCRVLLRELLCVGYTEPLLLTLKSTLTGDFLTALGRQFEVLDAIGEFRAQGKKPYIDIPFYGCSIPIGPGPEVARGSGGQTRDISPPVAMVPSPVTKQYVEQHWIKRAWLPAIEDRVDDTIRWSKAVSGLIAGAEEPRTEEDG